MSREQFIDKHKSLFWYTPESEKANISDALLAENILNYGTLDDYRDLIATLHRGEIKILSASWRECF